MYVKYLECLGKICGSVCCTCERVETSEIGLKEEFGRLKEVLQPGIHWINPCTESLQVESLKTKIVTLNNQLVYTKDNVSLTIDTALFYRVVDPVKVKYSVVDITSSLMETTYVVMRTICGELTLQDLLVQRQQVNKSIAQHISELTREWGTYVEHLIIKDLRLPPYLEENLSIVSKTKRMVESQIISAQADLNVAKLLRQASDLLEMKSAIQIRFLETVEEMTAMNGQKLILIPIQSQYLNSVQEKR